MRGLSGANLTLVLLAGCSHPGSGVGTPAGIPPATAVTTIASAPPPPSATADPHQTRLIAHMLKRVERARGLSAPRPVPGVLLDRAALIGQVKRHVSRELPPQAIRNEGLVLQLLGFVPTRFDYEAAEYGLLQDQLAGYYEPADGTMYMASDLGDVEAEATLAHELVHAVQDQHWNLQERSKYRPGDGDREQAMSALAEGDATSAMFDVIIARESPKTGKTALDLPDDVFADQIRQGMNQGPGANAPLVMRASLAAPYIYGTLFVHALRRRGGWEEVNRAWSDPPMTSEQIMHVEKWLTHEPAMKVEAPTFASLGAGWGIADEDSEGELGTRVAFEQWLEPASAADASTGWGGDRGVLISNGDRAAFAWRLRYDRAKTPNERAADVFPTVAHGIDRSLGAPAVREPWFECHERSDRGPLALARFEADVVLVAGPAETRSTAAWSSVGNCDLARKWTREIGRAH